MGRVRTAAKAETIESKSSEVEDKANRPQMKRRYLEGLCQYMIINIAYIIFLCTSYSSPEPGISFRHPSLSYCSRVTKGNLGEEFVMPNSFRNSHFL